MDDLYRGIPSLGNLHIIGVSMYIVYIYMCFNINEYNIIGDIP